MTNNPWTAPTQPGQIKNLPSDYLPTPRGDIIHDGLVSSSIAAGAALGYATGGLSGAAIGNGAGTAIGTAMQQSPHSTAKALGLLISRIGDAAGAGASAFDAVDSPNSAEFEIGKALANLAGSTALINLTEDDEIRLKEIEKSLLNQDDFAFV